MKISELFEARIDPETAGKKYEADFERWKNMVKKAHPQFASKMKFNGRVEGKKNTVSAEVAGLDRCFGVFNTDSGKGEVLGEGK